MLSAQSRRRLPLGLLPGLGAAALILCVFAASRVHRLHLDGRRACPAAPERAFYFWRTRWHGDPAETAALSALGASRLYVRFFDVEWDGPLGAPRPVAPLEADAPFPASVEVVPVVYLTNAVFLNLPYPEIQALSDAVWVKVEGIAARTGVSIHELQIDCDWSDASRRGYFHFAALLRQKLAARRAALSATIRLHQVKYVERTGLPPVDRGMLMFYNFGRIHADAQRSSIFNAQEAARYASYIAGYPLPLDVSLPLFSWVVHSRAGEVLGLVDKAGPAEIEASGAFRLAAPRQYEAARGLFFRGRYFMQGDRLLVEETTPVETLQAAVLAARGAGAKGFSRAALFDLDERNLARYSMANLTGVFDALKAESSR